MILYNIYFHFLFQLVFYSRVKSEAIALAGLAPSQGEEGHEELPDTNFLLVLSDASNIISSFQI